MLAGEVVRIVGTGYGGCGSGGWQRWVVVVVVVVPCSKTMGKTWWSMEKIQEECEIGQIRRAKEKECWETEREGGGGRKRS